MPGVSKRHVVVYRGGRALLDRQTLALLTARSVHTIRARCTIAEHTEDGRALYDMEQAVTVLAAIPQRRRTQPVAPQECGL